MKVRKKIIFERAWFNKRNDGERAEQFIVDLYKLVEDCDYGALEAEMFLDWLVIGVKDSSLSEKLQLDPELTLQ